MGKIFYVMGKSASGKDTIYKRLLESLPHLKRIILYTTRPMRDGEKNGVEYHFTTEEELDNFKKNRSIVEERVYNTAVGEWHYFTVDDGQIDVNSNENYLLIGTLESYKKMQNYYGADALVPIYIEVDDGQRLMRAIDRERDQKNQNYEEICRRFLADARDFSEDNLRQCGIITKFANNNLEECILKIKNMVLER